MTKNNLLHKLRGKAAILVAAALGMFTLSAQALSPIFTEQFGDYGNDGERITENGSLDFGWFVTNAVQDGSDVNDAVIDTSRFSPIPFSQPGNTQSVRLQRNIHADDGTRILKH